MKILTFSQLKPEKGIPYCRNHLMRKVELGEFPKPIHLSDRRIAWVESEVDGWLLTHADRRNVKEAA